MEHEYLTVQEIADRLRVEPRRIRDAIRDKELRAHRIGKGDRGEWRIAKADFFIYLQKRATMPPEEDNGQKVA